MSFLASLQRALSASHTAGLLVAVLLTAALVRAYQPEERRRLRSAVILSLLHLALVVTTALLESTGGADAGRAVMLVARLAEVAAFVGLAGISLFAVGLRRLGVEPPRIVQDTALAIAGVSAALLVAAASGYSLSGVITTSAVLTAIIGFSLQDTIGNVIGGLALQLDNSIEVGAWITVGGVAGRVAEIRWRYTALMTRDGELVLLPNSVLMKSQVTVLARGLQPGRWRRTVTFFADVRYAPTDVIEAVESALRAAEIPRVALDPAPDCILVELGDAQCRYAVRYWLKDPQADGPTDSVVRTRVFFALTRARIRLTPPTHAVAVSLREERPDEEHSEAEVARNIASLRTVDVLRSVAEAELAVLARDVRHAPFAAGEVMTRQGAEGHWLYVITEGTASVRVRVEGDSEHEVARLGPGRFFGEISLMTGRPREATVVAVTDVACLRLGADAFRRLLRVHPELADDFAEVLAERESKLVAARQGFDEQARARHSEARRADLAASIRSFFGLD
ncbi:MAG: mechanosensitive ion channel family protein [Polyangiales bacterium]